MSILDENIGASFEFKVSRVAVGSFNKSVRSYPSQETDETRDKPSSTAASSSSALSTPTPFFRNHRIPLLTKSERRSTSLFADSFAFHTEPPLRSVNRHPMKTMLSVVKDKCDGLNWQGRRMDGFDGMDRVGRAGGWIELMGWIDLVGQEAGSN